MALLGNSGESTSEKYQLNKKDGVKILRLFLVCVAGYSLTFFSGIISQVNWGMATPFVLALAPTIIEMARRFLTDYSTPQG